MYSYGYFVLLKAVNWTFMLKILIFGPFLKPKRAFDPLWWPYEPLFPAEMAFILNNYEEGVIQQWFYSNLECLNVSQYPKDILKKIWKKSRKSKNQKIKIPLVEKWHGWPIFFISYLKNSGHFTLSGYTS